jgi:VWFA-related protein
MSIAHARAALTVFCAMCAYSQDAPATFRSGVVVVTVPVVVRDRDGRAVGALTKDDFQLFDKGKPQVISRFTVEKADEPGATGDRVFGVESKAGAGQPPASRFVAYLFDDVHLPFADLARARIAAISYLNEALRPGDRAAVFTTSGKNTVDFTADREKLRHAIEQLTPQGRVKHTAADCPEIDEYLADQIVNKKDRQAFQLVVEDARRCPGKQTRLELEARARLVSEMADGEAQSAMEVLEKVVRRMASLPGEREVVVVSSGFLATMHRDQETDVMDEAIRAHVKVNSLDARGLFGMVPGGDASQSVGANITSSNTRILYQADAARSQGDVLGEFAYGTGGVLFHNNNDLLEGFRRTGQRPEFTYVLEFAPRDLKPDGSFHSLKVTVKTPGVTVEARQGYRAPRHANDRGEQTEEDIEQILFSRREEMGLAAELETGFVKTGENSARISVVAHVDLKRTTFKKDGEVNRTTLTVAAAVFDPDGILAGTLEKDFTLTLTDERLAAVVANGVVLPALSFNVARGSYTIRLVVRDAEGQTAARNGAVEIP